MLAWLPASWDSRLLLRLPWGPEILCEDHVEPISISQDCQFWAFGGGAMLTDAFPRKAFVWMLGNYPPRRCGIATFTHDLTEALRTNGTPCRVAAMDDGTGLDYGNAVELRIRQEDLADYIEAAEFMNESQGSAVFIQHEFGIFGGEAGSHLVNFLRFIKLPVVTTLHTVLDDPSPAQRMVIEEILSRSEKVVVMSSRAKNMLKRCYGRDDNVVVIPHGVPACPPISRESAKKELGWSGRKVVLTFGLLSPDKGVETMIGAMALITKRHPEALYVLAGQTHPHIRRDSGEEYRNSLHSLVEKLRLGGCVEFENRFVELDELCKRLTACDLYATPYLKMTQITSGTLAYAVGMGRCVVSTPYWHAAELLENGPGVLVEPRSVESFASAISELLSDDDRRHSLEAEARRLSDAFQWPRIGSKYLRLVEEVWSRTLTLALASRQEPDESRWTLPLQHLEALTDDVGLQQHAKYDIPNRLEGYCTDDNARALMLLWQSRPGDIEPSRRDRLERAALSFVLHAWNEENRGFRNFMSYDRAWLDTAGSKDCQGRAIYALAMGAAKAWTSAKRDLCEWLFTEAWTLEGARDCPRFAAQLLLAASERKRSERLTEQVRLDANLLAARLAELHQVYGSAEWNWFESVLTYDNARIPQALIEWGSASGDDASLELGSKCLAWLRSVQCVEGCFSPIGNEGFWRRGARRPLFGQQPLEAWASVAAYASAWNSSGDLHWKHDAAQALSWFYGQNAIGGLMVDLETGACSDGLERTGPNANRGAEACLSYLSTLQLLNAIHEPLIPTRLPLSLR